MTRCKKHEKPVKLSGMKTMKKLTSHTQVAVSQEQTKRGKVQRTTVKAI